MATAVLGLQWGDEGKGKITHLLARSASMVVRFNGGPNAGHTVIDRGVKFGTHLLPAGVFYSGVTSVLAGGVVIDLDVMTREYEEVARHVGRGPVLLLAENAHLILPYHRILEELEGSGSRFGTTRRGISPAYRDKVAHVGVRVGDLLEPGRLRERIAWRLDLLRREWPTCQELRDLDPGEIVRRQRELAEPWMGSIVDASRVVERALDAGDEVLFEGAQGTLLDVDFGTYPYVTSSSTIFAGIGTSLGIDGSSIHRRVGVTKAYQTRVGEGPFPTELADGIGASLRQRGGEFGTTTGRPRRCGWLDLVALRYAVRLNGITELALTKLDVLEGLSVVKVCCAYRIGGETIDRFPLSGDRLAECEAVYEELPGWNDGTGAGAWDELPAEAGRYVAFIEEATGVPVSLLSYGPSPEETLRRPL
jgi:adenylosuccinate synthase